MGTLLQFPGTRRDDLAQTLSGRAICSHCNHKWIGVAPVGGSTQLQCPKCLTEKGALVAHVVYQDVPQFGCTKCSGWLFTAILANDDTPCVACANCGNLINALDLFPT